MVEVGLQSLGDQNLEEVAHQLLTHQYHWTHEHQVEACSVEDPEEMVQQHL